MKAFLKLSKESKHPIVPRREWMDDVVLELVTAETLTGVVDRCIESGLYSLDLEATGLDTRVFDGRTNDKIVGACLSPDGVHGYYAPVRHRGDGAKANIPVSLFESELRRLANSKATAIFHNGKFDQELLQFCGGEPIGEWDSPSKWEDSLILAFLYNTRLDRIGLKYLADMFLNPNYARDVKRRRSGEKFPSYMIELKELYPADHNENEGYDFSELDPTWEPCVWYAAGDALFTYNLRKKLFPLVVTPETGISQRTIYNIEKMCCAATRWMERARVHIDQKKVAELIRLGQREYFDSIKAVYDFSMEHLGRDIAPAWWHVLSEGVAYEGEKENTGLLFNPDDVENDIRVQVEEAKKIVAHNAKRPTWDRSEPLEAIHAREAQKVETTLANGEVHDFPSQYDVMSARQLGPLFEEMEVPDLKRTEKTKQVMTTAAEMDRLTEKHGDTFPFMARIKRFREVQKALSQYLIPLRRDAHPSDSTIRVNYRAWATDTGRFSVKGDKNPSVNGGSSYPMHGTPATYDQDKPECLRRVRECIIPRPGFLLAALDFSGVELRIVTNLSREPKWTTEFFRCSSCEKTFDRGDGKSTPAPPPPFCPRCGSDKIGDLHTLSAIAFYGEAAQNDKKKFKSLRNLNAKPANFALCYGGSGNAVVRSTGVDENEGWRIYRQFTSTYLGLKAWWKNQHEFAKKHGYVNTAFGRRYPVPDIQLPRRDPKTGRDNGAFIAKAERNSVNGPIQGSSADITKLVMALIYKECKKRGWMEKVYMTITIHDELVFEIATDVVEEVLAVIMPIMIRSSPILKLKWPVPLTLDCELGYDWTVPWNLVTYVEGKEPWPEELKPFFPKSVAASVAKAKGEPEAQEPEPKIQSESEVTGTGGSMSGGEPAPDLSKDNDDAPVAGGTSTGSSGDVTIETSEGTDSASSGDTSQKPLKTPPALSKGELYVHRLRKQMRQGTVEILAQILHECRNRGTHPIEVRSPDGKSVIWKSRDFTLNPTQFAVLADRKGI